MYICMSVDDICHFSEIIFKIFHHTQMSRRQKRNSLRVLWILLEEAMTVFYKFTK